VLGQPWQQVILPDLNAGCSMADSGRDRAGGRLLGFADTPGLTDAGAGGLIPLTYMNSAAAIKGFTAGAAVWSHSSNVARHRVGFACQRFCFCPISIWGGTPRLRLESR
jgi:quinolinate synthase